MPGWDFLIFTRKNKCETWDWCLCDATGPLRAVHTNLGTWGQGCAHKPGGLGTGLCTQAWEPGDRAVHTSLGTWGQCTQA